MADHRYLDAEIDRNRADAEHIRTKRYKSYLALAFSLSGLAAWFAGLPDLVSYLLWASGIAAWMYVKSV